MYATTSCATNCSKSPVVTSNRCAVSSSPAARRSSLSHFGRKHLRSSAARGFHATTVQRQSSSHEVHTQRGNDDVYLSGSWGARTPTRRDQSRCLRDYLRGRFRGSLYAPLSRL